MNLKPAFSRFLESDPERLHFAAHSHHPWPDVSYEAHKLAWKDATRLADDKWEHIFSEVVPETQSLIASVLGLESGKTIALAPNTHEFLNRLFSCLDQPVRVLSTGSEFHSFTRQSRRWEEEGVAIVDRVPTEPFETFADRFTAEARSGAHDLVYLSQVFFDSAFVVPDIDRIVAALSEEKTFMVIDGYHAFMAMPVDLGAIQDRAFFIAGGYKYAMAGEGAVFMHCPPGYGSRPLNTGWYAGFGQLETGVSREIPYGTDGSRFFGATFDVSGIYRMRANLQWLEHAGATPKAIHTHVVELQDRLLDNAPHPGHLVPAKGVPRGNFLTFETTRAGELYGALHDRGVITDYRGNRLRFGFGVYQDVADVDRLTGILDDLALS